MGNVQPGKEIIDKLGCYSDEEIKQWSWRKEKGKQWYIASGARDLEKKCQVSFDVYCGERETVFKSSFKQLEKDIPRTHWRSFKSDSIWRDLVRAREARCGREAQEKAIMDILVAFIRREERGDGHGSRSYTQGLNYVVCLLLLFVDEEEKAFWLLCALIEHVAPNDLYAEQPSALAGAAGEAAIVHYIISKLPYAKKYVQSDDERNQISQVLCIKMGIPLLVNCVSPQVLCASWDCLFLYRDFDIIPCAIAAAVECVCKHSIARSEDQEDNDVSVLCTVLRALDQGDPFAQVSDIEACFHIFHDRTELRKIRTEARAALARSWSEENGRLNDLTQLGFSLEDLMSLREAFLFVAGPHGHYLDKHQFLSLMKNIDLPLPPSAAERILEIVDSDGNGQLDFREVVCCLSTLSSSATTVSINERLCFMFSIYDADNSGFLEWDEVQQLAKACNMDHDLLNRLKALDLDRDGRISRQEWLIAVTSSPELLRALGFDLRALGIGSENEQERAGNSLDDEQLSLEDRATRSTNAPRSEISQQNHKLIRRNSDPIAFSSKSHTSPSVTSETLSPGTPVRQRRNSDSSVEIDSPSTRALRALRAIRQEASSGSESHSVGSDNDVSPRTSSSFTFDYPSSPRLRTFSSSESTASTRRDRIVSFLFGRCTLSSMIPSTQNTTVATERRFSRKETAAHKNMTSISR